MSMRSLLQAVRTALINDDDLTDQVDADKITFARRPQRDDMPGITFSIGTVAYDESILLANEATTYRVNINVYGRTADETTLIHDLVKATIQSIDSATYVVRLEDERYAVDVDNNHVALLATTWQLCTGSDAVNTVNYISPAFQGYDHMRIKYLSDLANNASTTLSLVEQVYFLRLAQHGGALSHTLYLPSAEDNQGKIYTFFSDDTFDNNSQARLMPDTGESVQEEQSYDLNRADASVTIVACKTNTTDFGWRILAYNGLHD